MSAFEKIGTDRQLQDHWIRRLISGVIDYIIILIVAWIISIIIAIPALLLTGVFFVREFSLLHGILFFLYASFFESSRGTTIGKQIMNLKVTTTQGNVASLYGTLIRNISKIHLLLWLIDTLIGMATVGGGDPHQKYSDRFAGTTVASTIPTGLILPSPPSPQAPPTPSSSA